VNGGIVDERADGVTPATVEDGVAAGDYKRSPKKTKKKMVRRSVRKVDGLNRQGDNQTAGRTAVRLPALPIGGGGGPRPDRYGNQAALDTVRSFERQRGIGSRDYAVRCLALAQRFNERPWLQQVRQAVTIATIGVRRVYGHQPHLFAGDNVIV